MHGLQNPYGWPHAQRADPWRAGCHASASGSKAALAGQSLNEYLLARLTDVASVPTVPELAERVRSRAAYTGPPAATVIRQERDAR